MNKQNMFCSVFLMFSVATTAFPIYEQEREILYTMHTLEQDLANVPMVKQNIDMFIGIFQMNSQLLEKKLAIANQKTKKALLANVLVLGSVTVGKFLFSSGSYGRDMANLLYNVSNTLVGISVTCTGLGLYDVFKERNALKEALALDQQILEQLLTIKDLAMFSFDDDKAQEAIDPRNKSSEDTKQE